MSDFHALTLPFEGEPLTTLSWDGKPAWVGREIGRRLGYAGNGKRLVTRIGREWAGEFIEGKDYVLLSGDELAAFKAAVGLGTPEVPSRAGELLLLLEPGLHLVLTKTNKPIGVRLRRFLVDEVLPQLVRTGSYAPRGPTVVVEETVLVVAFDAPTPPPTGLAVRREERLARQARGQRRGRVGRDEVERVRRLDPGGQHRPVPVPPTPRAPSWTTRTTGARSTRIAPQRAACTAATSRRPGAWT